MKPFIFGSCLLLSAFIWGACNNSNSTSQDPVDSAKAVNKAVKPVEKDASDFAVKAADGGMMEVALGRIAQEKASSQRVRDFGAMMVKDHTEANENLKHIAVALQVALPDSVGDDTKKEIDKLAKKNGKDFDKSYMDMMVEDHEKDVAEFRKAADKCSDSTIKSFAAVTLPTLEKHLDSARAITGKK
ncbi:MAG TPA: DUF4142 domain-containing protein [Puia sp.]|nr:DUF4142 domain-containing protein [Puia sp.]